MNDTRRVLLIADDDDNDRVLLEHTLKSLDPSLTIRTVADGHEALSYLEGSGKFSDRKSFPFPTFVFVDLKMPKLDGFAVLQALKKHPEWSLIPTIVFTASADLDDVKKAFLSGASAYHVKPMTCDGRKKLCRLLLDYWSSSEIPQTDAHGRLLETVSTGKLGEKIPEPFTAGK